MKQITVAAGILYGEDGSVLLAQRPPGSHQEEWWEFPGGKLEANETPHMALVRELNEELGIQVLASRPFMDIRHCYEDREVHLLVREVLRYQGEAYGAESQAIEWVSLKQLSNWKILPADKPVISALSLPHQYLITPDFANMPLGKLEQQLLTGLERALESGIRLIQLRLVDLERESLKKLGQRAVQLVRSHNGYLLLNEDCQLAQEIGADGAHLKAQQLQALTQRPQGLKWVGASTHNSDELAQAAALGCDFVCVSPVRKTRSHPEAIPLNWHGLKKLCDSSNLPVFALGGVRLEDFDQAREAGAIGVAGIGAFWPNL